MLYILLLIRRVYMRDCIEEFCNRNQIGLVYTENNVVVLSTGYSKGKPNIRVHESFKGCPINVAEAIEDYYILFQNTDNSLKIIEEYVMTQYNSHNFIIRPPQNKYRNLLNKGITADTDNALMVEMKISHIINKHFRGSSIHMKPDQIIKTEGDKVIELEITVEKL